MEVFVLKRKRLYRLSTNIYMRRGEDKKLEKREIVFSTEHLVTDKDRIKKAKKIAAEFMTDDERLIDGILRDPGYGKTFVHKNDPEGKRKLPSFVITSTDAKLTALRNLFGYAKMEFDESKSYDVLLKEYEIHTASLSNVNLSKGESGSVPIPHQEVDVLQNIGDQAKAACDKFEKESGIVIPEELRQDLSFVDGLSNPQFDAKAYIDKYNAEHGDEEGDDLPDTAEELQALYKTVTGNNAPNPKKNDVEWLTQAIKKHQSGATE